jgi:hypothetical protein
VFLKCSTRKKDGKEHRSWSVVESRRVGRGVVQRHVLYLGEINLLSAVARAASARLRAQVVATKSPA